MAASTTDQRVCGNSRGASLESANSLMCSSSEEALPETGALLQPNLERAELESAFDTAARCRRSNRWNQFLSMNTLVPARDAFHPRPHLSRPEFRTRIERVSTGESTMR